MMIRDLEFRSFMDQVNILSRLVVGRDYIVNVEYVHFLQGYEVRRYADFSAAVSDARSVNGDRMVNEVDVYCDIVFFSGNNILLPVDLIHAVKKEDDADA